MRSNISIFIKIIFFIALSITLLANDEILSDKRISLEEIDNIVTKADNLNEFLNSSEIQGEYFKGLQNYFGEDRFPRESYDGIIKQLKEVNAKFPEIAERAWQTNDLGKSFQINLSIKSSGLKVKQDKFLTWLNNWQKELQDQAFIDVNQDSNLSKVVAQLQKDIVKHFEETSNLKKKDKDKKTGKFFDELRNRKEYKEIVSAALLERVNQESVNDLLRAGDADLVLSTLDKLGKSKDFTVNGQVLPVEIQNLIGREVPKLETPPLVVIGDKGAETALFQAETIKTRRGKIIPVGRGSKTLFEVRPIPRRIHGIFKGIPLNECVAGNCKSLNSLTPERWATSLLEDTHFYHIEKVSDVARSYEGFTQLVPGKIGKQTYASADLGSPLFGKKVVSPEGEIGIFYDLWAKEATKNLPLDSRGIIISEATGGDNAGVLDSIRKRPSYLMGKIVNKDDPFVITDDLAKKFSSLGIREGLAKNYSGKMIFDAVIPNAKNLTLIDPKLDLPTNISFSKAVSLIKNAKGTEKENILAEILPQRMRPLTDQERKVLRALTLSMPQNKNFFLSIYGSKLIDKLTDKEAKILRGLGKEGKELIVRKDTGQTSKIYEWLETSKERYSFLETMVPSIKVLDKDGAALNVLLKDPDVAIPAAKMLQYIGKQTQESDNVIMSAINLSKGLSDSEISMIANYIKETKSYDTNFLNEIANKGLVSDNYKVAEESLNALLKKENLDEKLSNLIINKIYDVKDLRHEARLANIFFFNNGNPTPKAQSVYLSVIGSDKFVQKGYIESLYKLKTIDADALKFLANQFINYDDDRRWAVTKFLRDAKNIDQKTIEQTFGPLLKHENSRLRTATARVLASKGIINPEVEALLIFDAKNTNTERTLAALDSQYQVSEKARDQLISLLENGETPDFSKEILMNQKSLNSNQIERLKRLQDNPALKIRDRAASILLEQNAGTTRTMEVIIETLGNESWDQNAVVARIQKGLKELPVSDKAILDLKLKQAQFPKEVDGIKQLIPDKTPKDSIIPSADLDIYFNLLKKSDQYPEPLEVQALTRLLTNPDFPNTAHVYDILKKYKGKLGAVTTLQKGLQTNSELVRFYSALLLTNKEQIQDASVEKALAYWYTHQDISIEKGWSSLGIKELLPQLERIRDLSYDEDRRLTSIYKRAELDEGTVEKLLKYVKSDNRRESKFAIFILENNKSAHTYSQIRSLLKLDPVVDPTKDLITKIFKKNGEIASEDIKTLNSILGSNKIEHRILAALTLESKGIWNSDIESAFIDVLLDPEIEGSWEIDHFNTRIAANNLSDEGFKRLTSLLTNKDKQFDALDVLTRANLSKKQISQIRLLQKSGSKDTQLMSAALLFKRKIPDSDAKNIIIMNIDNKDLNPKWLKGTLESFEFGPREISSFKSLFEQTDEISQLTIDIFFHDKPNNYLLAAYEDLLDSKIEKIRVNAASILSDYKMTPKIEKILAEALTSNMNWNRKFFFNKLENMTSLSAEAQKYLAQDIVKTMPKDESYSVRLLRNQLSLDKEAKAILQKNVNQNILIKEILSNKKVGKSVINDCLNKILKIEMKNIDESK